MMSEEQVTKLILEWLLNKKWNIIAFDFPQSGTGIYLHPNDQSSEKNDRSINVDIIAVKDKKCVFLENKDRYFYPDFLKMNSLIKNNKYTKSIDRLLSKFNIEYFYYGIGLPSSGYNEKAKKSAKMVDFVVGVNENESIKLIYSKYDDIF